MASQSEHGVTDGHEEPRGTVLIVDDDRDLRDTLGDILADVFERRSVTVGSYQDLVDLGGSALDCDVAILDVNLGQDRPSGVDVYEWLLENGFHGRVVFLTGHARTHPAVERAGRLEAVDVYQKPISLKLLRSLIDEAP